MDFKYYQDLIDICSQNMKIHSVFQFVERVHQLSGSKDNNCEIEIFVRSLKVVLVDPKKGYNEQRKFFVSHCINFSRVFKSMSNLRKNENFVFTLLEGLKFWREVKKCLDKELEEIKKKNDHEISQWDKFWRKSFFCPWRIELFQYFLQRNTWYF